MEHSISREQFADNIERFLTQYDAALRLGGEPPQPPDLSGFIPETEEDFALIATLIAKLKEARETSEEMMQRARTALEAPRLNRVESIDSGRTLFDEA